MTKTYSISNLKQLIAEIFISYGLTPLSAEISADIMVDAESAGVYSHGLITLPGHLSRLKNKQYNLHPTFTTAVETPSFATLDGDNAIGYHSARIAMNRAIEGAKQSGMFTVFSRNNNTFGPGFHYVWQAAKEGMIGVALCNTPPSMAPWNGTARLLGTNPVAMGAFVPGKDPLLFDMATSKVAKSKLKPHLESSTPIPEGWALDADGHPTTDPVAAVKGLMLPMADHKGAALSMMIDILSGMLSGAAFLDQVNKFYDSSSVGMQVGFCMMAFDPGIILKDSYNDSILEFRRRILASPSIEGKPPVRLPGASKFKSIRKAQEQGLLIKKSSLNSINQRLSDDDKPFKL